MKDIKQGLAITICSTAIAITFLIVVSVNITTKHKAQVNIKEHETALALVKICGKREWIAWWEHHPIKGRRIKCLERIPIKKK